MRKIIRCIFNPDLEERPLIYSRQGVVPVNALKKTAKNCKHCDLIQSIGGIVPAKWQDLQNCNAFHYITDFIKDLFLFSHFDSEEKQKKKTRDIRTERKLKNLQ